MRSTTPAACPGVTTERVDPLPVASMKVLPPSKLTFEPDAMEVEVRVAVVAELEARPRPLAEQLDAPGIQLAPLLELVLVDETDHGNAVDRDRPDERGEPGLVSGDEGLEVQVHAVGATVAHLTPANGQAFTVVGIMPAAFLAPQFTPDVWMPTALTSLESSAGSAW